MALAPKDAEDLYLAAQKDLAAPSREKALKWVFWASHYLKLKIEMQARSDAADAAGRAAAIRGDDKGAAVMGACSEMLGTAAQLHAIALDVRDLLMATAPMAQRFSQPQSPPTPQLRTVNGGKSK